MNTTKNKIQMGNKLIAEFMRLDADLFHVDKCYNPKYNDGTISPMQFHKSWDWLMPVVIECLTRYDVIEDNNTNHQFKINDALVECNIDSLYKVVVEFIKWNNRKQEMNNTPKPEFLAIYNPYTRELLVKYGNAVTYRSFDHLEEWCVIPYNNEEDFQYYLHVQLDYDETMQLLFYPRVVRNESLHEDLGSYYNSEEKKEGNIVIVHTDKEWDVALKSHLQLDTLTIQTHKKINY